MIEGTDITGEAILADHALVNRNRRPDVLVPRATYIEPKNHAHAARTALWSSKLTRPEDLRRQRYQ